MWILRGLDAGKVAVGYFAPSAIQGMSFIQVFLCTGDENRSAVEEAEDKVHYLNGGSDPRVLRLRLEEMLKRRGKSAEIVKELEDREYGGS